MLHISKIVANVTLNLNHKSNIRAVSTVLPVLQTNYNNGGKYDHARNVINLRKERLIRDLGVAYTFETFNRNSQKWCSSSCDVKGVNPKHMIILKVPWLTMISHTVALRWNNVPSGAYSTMDSPSPCPVCSVHQRKRSNGRQNYNYLLSSDWLKVIMLHRSGSHKFCFHL